MKQISSKTITSPRAAVSSIGMRHGEHGSETHASSAIAAWLARRTPEEVDQAAVWRASQHGIEVSLSYKTTANFERGVFDQLDSCVITGESDRFVVANDLRGFLTPAPIPVIEGWLAELSVITARRQGDQFEEELRLAAYSSRLAKFPADIARYVCLTHTWKFWPTWAEMEEICQRKAMVRHRLIMELESSPESELEERKAPTSEERERGMQMIAELFPALARSRKEAAEARSREGNDV